MQRMKKTVKQMRLVDADELIKRCMNGVDNGFIPIIEEAPTVPAFLIPTTNSNLFKQIFGIYATELWSMPEEEFLEWLNREVIRND